MVAILIIQATLAMGKLCKIMKILHGLFIVSLTKAEVRALLDSTSQSLIDKQKVERSEAGHSKSA